MSRVLTSTMTAAEPRMPQPNLLLRAFKRWQAKSNWLVNLSVIVLILTVIAILGADALAPYDMAQMHMRDRLRPPVFVEGGSPAYALGTDALGRDTFSRILHGGRVSLAVSVLATSIGLLIGTTFGVISGYAGGWIDAAIMYVVDVLLSLPFILLAIAVSLVLGTSLTVLIMIAALATFPYYTRVIRASVLALKQHDYVLVAQSIGATHTRVMLRHLLPGLVSPVLVLTTLNVGRMILLESGLSFIGIGVPPTIPTWGSMINEGRAYLATAWWLATMPGIALVILTMAFGVLGDWLRDVLDVTV